MKGPSNVAIIFGVMAFFGRCSSQEASFETFLTTAKVRDGDLIPKPTSYLSRINVEPVNQSLNTSYGLGIIGPQRKANTVVDVITDDVWQWDYWCQLQPKTGNCSAAGNKTSVAYYYVAHMDSCQTFQFSGCNGNKNNFKTLTECERNCKAASRMTLKETNHLTYCALQPNVGMCWALMEKYYYDIKTNECKSFTYGGCGGNQNRFDNIEKCEELCKNKLK